MHRLTKQCRMEYIITASLSSSRCHFRLFEADTCMRRGALHPNIMSCCWDILQA